MSASKCFAVIGDSRGISRGYHSTKKLKRLPYASPEQPKMQGLSDFMQGWED
jgi:hypothetical protein